MRKKTFVFLTTRANEIHVMETNVMDAWRKAQSTFGWMFAGEHVSLRPIYNIAKKGECPPTGWKKVPGVDDRVVLGATP